MADEQKEVSADKSAAPAKKKQTFMMLGILVAVMLVEGGGIYFAVKFFGGGPVDAAAAGLTPTAGTGEGHGGDAHGAPAVAQSAELPVTKFKAPNLKTGRLYLYEIEIYARTSQEKAEDLKKRLEANKATIDDRLNRVIRSSEPQDLQEDGLETLRRQIRHELSQVVGDEKMIEEILIPKCTPFKVDY